MSIKTSLDWKFHVVNFFILVFGLALITSGIQVFDSPMITHIGIWVILFSVVAFLIRNIMYMGESTDHGKNTKMKQSPPT